MLYLVSVKVHYNLRVETLLVTIVIQAVEEAAELRQGVMLFLRMQHQILVSHLYVLTNDELYLNVYYIITYVFFY